jgi:putative tryptophan/tyrosine transport system substrate-binding protein
MRRRRFLGVLSGAAVTWPLVARAQQVKPTIGFLDPGVPQVFAGFTEGLRDLGYVEGQNITYVWRSAGGNPNVLPELAAELVALRVDIIATVASLPVRAAKSATSTIPIVFLVGDAVTTGTVSNLSRPGGNLTGVSFLNDELSSKRLELLRDAMPSLQSVAVFHDPNTSRKFLEVTEETGRRLGLKLHDFALAGVDTFEQAFAAVAAGRLDAVDVLASAFFNANRDRFAELALKYRLPAIYRPENTCAPVVCFHTGQTSPTCSSKPLPVPTKSSREQNPVIFPSSSQPNSRCWSISKQQRPLG